jgi:hypothetical protein
MARPLAEYFRSVRATDVHDYGCGQHGVGDFLLDWPGHVLEGTNTPPDWIFTNPPFKRASEFIRLALRRAHVGVAMLLRSNFMEGQQRYETLFRDTPPTKVLPFAERVIMAKGILRDPAVAYFDASTGEMRRPSTATAYAWFVWIKGQPGTSLEWIAPCRHRLERPGDYPATEVVAPGPLFAEERT